MTAPRDVLVSHSGRLPFRRCAVRRIMTDPGLVAVRRARRGHRAHKVFPFPRTPPTPVRASLWSVSSAAVAYARGARSNYRFLADLNGWVAAVIVDLLGVSASAPESPLAVAATCCDTAPTASIRADPAPTICFSAHHQATHRPPRPPPPTDHRPRPHRGGCRRHDLSPRGGVEPVEAAAGSSAPGVILQRQLKDRCS